MAFIDKIEQSVGMDFNLAEGNRVLIEASSPGELHDVLRIVNDFIGKAGEHITSYSTVNLSDANIVADALQEAVNGAQNSILLSRTDFLHLSSLVGEYKSHGYGTISQACDAPAPLPQDVYEKIAQAYKNAEDTLFPPP